MYFLQVSHWQRFLYSYKDEPSEKVKVCLEDDDFKECQTKNLPKDEDSTLKFTLDYEAWEENY